MDGFVPQKQRFGAERPTGKKRKKEKKGKIITK